MNLNNNTFENDYILGILTHMVAEMHTAKPPAVILDKYAVQLTAYMNGKRTSGVPAMSFHVQELRPEVLAFALLMESRLRAKDADKGQGWKRKTDIDLTVNVCTAARHIEQSLFPHKGENSIKALVDMSNHCMMLADVLGALECDEGGPGWAGVDQVNTEPLEIPAFLRAFRDE